MRAWLWAWVCKLIPVDLHDWPEDAPVFVPAPLSADIDCIVAGCRWGRYGCARCECD